VECDESGVDEWSSQPSMVKHPEKAEASQPSGQLSSIAFPETYPHQVFPSPEVTSISSSEVNDSLRPVNDDALLDGNPSFVSDAVLAVYETTVDSDASDQHRCYHFSSLTRTFDWLHQRSRERGGPMGYNLTQNVKGRLDDVVKSGFCVQDEADKVIKPMLRVLSEKCALESLARLTKYPRPFLRKLGSLLMARMKEVMEEDTQLGGQSCRRPFNGDGEPMGQGRWKRPRRTNW
jgi:hypothetical protein